MAAVGAPAIGDRVLRWKIPPGAVNQQALELRNGFARKLADAAVEEVWKQYTHFTPAQIHRLLRDSEKHVLGRRLQGVGVELGAGTAVMAAVVASDPGVSRVYAVECAPQVVERLQPKVIEGLLGPEGSHKVWPVVGSFDFLEVPDEAADFAVEIESWHHSDDLARSVGEAYRVVRPGGVVLGFDRFQPDDMTDEAVEALLNQVYDQAFLKRNGYPMDLILTRRANGEHEYRRREWLAAFRQAGFRQISIQPLERAADSLSNSLLRLVRLGPRAKAKVGSPRSELRRWVRQRLRQRPYSPKSFTCFALRKE